MTTREFLQHIILNCELDDPVTLEARIGEGQPLVHLVPVHAYKIGEDYEPETLIECKLYKEDN